MPVEWDFMTAMHGLKEGDSFFVPTIDIEATRTELYRVAHELGMRVTVRVALRDGALGVRCAKANPRLTEEDGFGDFC